MSKSINNQSDMFKNLTETQIMETSQKQSRRVPTNHRREQCI